MLSTHLGHKLIHHGGNLDGYSAQIDRFVSDNLTVIVLTNNEAHAAINITRVIDEQFVPNPDFESIPSLTQQGRYAYELQQYDEALRFFLRALEKGDETPTTAFNAARSFSLLGQKNDALNYLQRAASLGYDNLERLNTDRSLLQLQGDARWSGIVTKVTSNRDNQN